jgi:hypothetical protein
VRLWSNALLFSEQKAKVESIIDAVRTHSLLSQDEFEALLRSNSRADLCGFPKDIDVPNVPRLHELIGENWIGERILDTRAHQIMMAVNSNILPDEPPILHVFPIIFNTYLTVAYNANRLSKGLKDIRDSLLANLPRFLAFIFNKKNVHWAACIIATKDLVIHQGDSLRWPPDKELLPKLRWFLGDVMEEQGTWSESVLPVPLQASGSGSCGIIAMSTIHSFVDPTVTPWSNDKSSDFRLNWLKAVLQSHITAIRNPNTVSTYLTKRGRCPTNDSTLGD